MHFLFQPQLQTLLCFPVELVGLSAENPNSIGNNCQQKSGARFYLDFRTEDDEVVVALKLFAAVIVVNPADAPAVAGYEHVVM
jgi:hypothetical protein